MSQFVVCEVCGRHDIRGVHTCSKCGNNLRTRSSDKVEITNVATGNIDYSMIKVSEQ